MADNKQKARRSPGSDEQRIEPDPNDCDIEELGDWLADRNRKVLDMLEEYDRRQRNRERP